MSSAMTPLDRGAGIHVTSSTLAPAPHRQTVVHGAVRHAVQRDLERLALVLTEPVTAVRRAALIGHSGFLLDQLLAHHRLQDRAIWPAVVARRPDLADLGERVARSHAELLDPIGSVRQAVLRWKAAPGERLEALSALQGLGPRLTPVLDLDTELLPVACAAMPADGWAAVERRPWPGGPAWLGSPGWLGSPTRLARRTFWLLDELDPARAALLLHRTPSAVMWVLRNGFSGAYNRSAYLMWVGGGTGPVV